MSQRGNKVLSLRQGPRQTLIHAGMYPRNVNGPREIRRLVPYSQLPKHENEVSANLGPLLRRWANRAALGELGNLPEHRFVPCRLHQLESCWKTYCGLGTAC